MPGTRFVSDLQLNIDHVILVDHLDDVDAFAATRSLWIDDETGHLPGSSMHLANTPLFRADSNRTLASARNCGVMPCAERRLLCSETSCGPECT